jgi:hypothetical protein
MGIDPYAAQHYHTPSMEETGMHIDSSILRNLQLLSPEDQKKVAEYVETLAAATPRRSLKNPEGMFTHHAVDMPLEMFQEARREMWANFPREFPKTGGE